MKRGSRVWRLYYGIQAAIWVSALGVFLGVRFLVKEAWGPDIVQGPGILFLLAYIWIERRAESVAKAACRKAGLWQEAPRGSRIERQLLRTEFSEAPVPNLAPLDLGQHSRRSNWALVCCFAVMGVVGVSMAIHSWSQRDWDDFTTSVLTTPVFLGLATIGLLSIRTDEVKVDKRGLHLKSHVVPWSAIKSGKISQWLTADGTLHSEELTLKDASGKQVWRTSTRCLPLRVRAALFAWVQARTGLHEPNLHEEMYAWLESISGAFAHKQTRT